MAFAERQTPDHDIVPANPPQRGGSSGLWYVGVAVASGIAAFYPFVGICLLGASLRTLVERRGCTAFAGSAAAAAVAPVVLGAMYGITSGLALLPPLIVAFGIVALMHAKRAGVTEVVLIIAVVTLLCLGYDQVMVTLSGEGGDLGAVTVEYLMGIIGDSAGTGVDADAFVASIEGIISVLWPFLYVMSVATNALAAAVGSRLAATRPGVSVMPSLASFDLPVWFVGLLGLSVLGIGVSMMDAPYAGAIASASVTVCMSVRLIFAWQGLAVLAGVMTRHRVGCLVQALVIVFAVWIETVSFILSIVGLVDVWANFRGLPRKGSDSSGR